MMTMFAPFLLLGSYIILVSNAFMVHLPQQQIQQINIKPAKLRLHAIADLDRPLVSSYRGKKAGGTPLAEYYEINGCSKTQEIRTDPAVEQASGLPEENYAKGNKKDQQQAAIMNDVIFNGTISFQLVKNGNENNIADDEKELLLYLPGIDGLGISASPHFDQLSRSFEFWRAEISGSDRSEFEEYVDQVINVLEKITTQSRAAAKKGQPRRRRATILAESTGAVVAARVAALREDLVAGLALVNPGTSYPRSPWPVLAPLVTGAPTPAAKVLGAGALIGTTTDPDLFQKVRAELEARDLPPPARPAALLATLRGYWRTFDEYTDDITPATVQWRASRWLEQGAKKVEPALGSLAVPALVVAGEDDRLLPSAAEARRLKALIPDCEAQVVKGAGHALLYEPARYNLTEALLGAAWLRKKGDPVEDWVYPSKEKITKAVEALGFFERAFSPVFLSTAPDGRTVRGLGAVPANGGGGEGMGGGGPLLFVGNHQLLALDLSLLVAEFAKEKDYIPRGLAFQGAFGGGGGGPGGGGAFGDGGGGSRGRDGVRTVDPRQRRRAGEGGGGAGGASPWSAGPGGLAEWGAVPVTPRNFYRLLERGDPVLLFPGGIREAYHERGEEYQLFWPEEREDFVRMAARFDATIVPFGAVGCADTAEVILGPREILNTPFIGARARGLAEGMKEALPMFRSDDVFLSPLVRPRLPSRFYFKFGKPIPTKGIKSKDSEMVAKVYKEAKNEVENCISYLLEAREQDPYKNAQPRLLYERLMGRKAPTFPLNIVDSMQRRKSRS